MEQLLLFAEPLEGKLLRDNKETKESLRKIQRCLFGKNAKLEQMLLDLSKRLDILEAGLCRNELVQKPCEIIEMALM